MCGRYRNHLTISDLRAVSPFPLVRPEPSATPNLEPQDDIRPTTDQWVIRQADDGAEAVKMRWWLVPFFHKGKPIKAWKATTFNAKCETVSTAASFKGAFQRRRCLVPASAWDEWTYPEGRKVPGLRWSFTAEDGAPLTFAGLWDRCETSDAGVVESFTIVTQPAGAPLNGYHDRAPIVIWEEDRRRWLTLGHDVTDLLRPESPDRFDAKAVERVATARVQSSGA